MSANFEEKEKRNFVTMPDHLVTSDKLSGIEEETDMYEAFAPHVDASQITFIADSPPGNYYLLLFVLIPTYWFGLLSNRRIS